jgi:putative copper export protein
VKQLKQLLKKTNWLVVAQMVVVMVIALAPFAFSGHATAQTPYINNFTNQCQGTGVRCDQNVDLPSLFKTIINYALGIAFFVAVIYLIYGGFLYITSAGNEESAEKGKNAIVYSLIGIVVIVLSFVIVSAVYRFVANNT